MLVSFLRDAREPWWWGQPQGVRNWSLSSVDWVWVIRLDDNFLYLESSLWFSVNGFSSRSLLFAETGKKDESRKSTFAKFILSSNTVLEKVWRSSNYSNLVLPLGNQKFNVLSIYYILWMWLSIVCELFYLRIRTNFIQEVSKVTWSP